MAKSVLFQLWSWSAVWTLS